MPKMKCKCGNVLSYGSIPCSIEYKFISDTEFDKFSNTINAEKLYMQMNIILKCSNRNRLWVFWNGFSKKLKEYIEV